MGERVHLFLLLARSIPFTRHDKKDCQLLSPLSSVAPFNQLQTPAAAPLPSLSLACQQFAPDISLSTGSPASSPPCLPIPATEMAMTGGMALAGDPFRENKESSSAYWTKQDGGSPDFFDEYVMLDDEDPLGPGGHASGRYYDEDLDFVPAERIMTPPASIDTSQLALAADSTAADPLQPPNAALFFQHQRYGSHTPGPQPLTQQTLERQSGHHHPGSSSSSAQRRLNSSASDTELQRLEDLSMQSPHRRGTAPPPSHSYSHSRPVSPRTGPAPTTTAQQSPKKLNRMEMLYASIRKATTMRVRKMSSAPIGSDIDDDNMMRGRSMRQQQQQGSHSQMPMTPPPTGRMVPATPSQHDPLGISFVSGQFDDPFEGTFAGQQNGHVVGYPPQPGGYGNGMMLAGTGDQAPPNWPLADGYASSSGNSVDDMVWAGNSQPQHMAPQTPAGQAWYAATPGNPMKSVTRQSSSEFGAQSAMNATLNLAMQLQQGGGQLYHTDNSHHHYGHQHHQSDSGITMHMPQPRQPVAPILHPGHQQQQQHTGHGHGHSHSLSLDPQTHAHLAPPSHPRPPRAGSHYASQQLDNLPNPSTPQRRPKPRAPSSGARHTSLSLTSPRKQPPALNPPQHQPRGRSTSSSPGKTAATRSARRVTSASDLGHPSTPSSKVLDRDLPITAAGGVLNSSVRKRRSRSKSMSRHAARTPSHGSLSSANGGGNESSSSPTKRGSGQIGFVNYTPDDCKVLMTGVAPSGSSKTKARREREAAERQRRMSEAVMKAVAAAGGDVGLLREEGIVLDGEDGMVY